MELFSFFVDIFNSQYLSFATYCSDKRKEQTASIFLSFFYVSTQTSLDILFDLILPQIW